MIDAYRHWMHSFCVNLSFWYQDINANKTNQLTNVATMFISVKVTLSSILADMINILCRSDCPMTVTKIPIEEVIRCVYYYISLIQLGVQFNISPNVEILISDNNYYSFGLFSRLFYWYDTLILNMI